MRVSRFSWLNMLRAEEREPLFPPDFLLGHTSNQILPKSLSTWPLLLYRPVPVSADIITCRYLSWFQPMSHLLSIPILTFLLEILQRGNKSRLSAQCTGHSCNEGVLAKFIETNCMQWTCVIPTADRNTICHNSNGKYSTYFKSSANHLRAKIFSRQNCNQKSYFFSHICKDVIEVNMVKCYVQQSYFGKSDAKGHRPNFNLQIPKEIIPSR